jgi:hypothetical protein
VKATQKYEVVGMGVRSNMVQLVLQIETKPPTKQPMTGTLWIEKKTYNDLRLRLYDKVKVTFNKKE